MDFSWKQKDFCQKCTRFFRSEMPLDQIGTPCSYVGHISFNCYLSLVLEALWGYLQANKFVSHNNSKVALVN